MITSASFASAVIDLASRHSSANRAAITKFDMNLRKGKSTRLGQDLTLHPLARYRRDG